MKAVVLRELGEASQLTAADWPDPEPGPGDVVVRLRAAALNRRDVWIRRGLYAKIALPVILGSDGAGTVDAVGSDVGAGLLHRDVVINPSMNWTSTHAPSEGVEVLGMPRNGTYAERIVVPAWSVAAKPSHLSFEQSAALPLAGVTAYRATVTRARVTRGDRVLVTGIGGGVATCAVLFAVQLGATVYVTSGSEEKIERARSLGATGGVNYADPSWEQQLTRQAGGLFDVVIDGAGGDAFAGALAILAPGGRLVSYGATLGKAKDVEVRRIFWKQLDVMGSTMGSPDDFAGMLSLVNRGVVPAIDTTFALEEAAAAHDRLESGQQFGKVVLRID